MKRKYFLIDYGWYIKLSKIVLEHPNGKMFMLEAVLVTPNPILN